MTAYYDERKSIMQRPLRTGKLLDSEIPDLRRRVRSKATTVAQEADRYDVGIETIRRAVRGETFRHIREGLDDVFEPPAVERRTDRLPTPEEIAESQRKFLESHRAAENQREAVDEFLRKRSEGDKE